MRTMRRQFPNLMEEYGPGLLLAIGVMVLGVTADWAINADPDSARNKIDAIDRVYNAQPAICPPAGMPPTR